LALTHSWLTTEKENIGHERGCYKLLYNGMINTLIFSRGKRAFADISNIFEQKGGYM